MAKLTTDEAIQVCNDWFAHILAQQEKTKKIVALAALAKTDPVTAKRKLNEIDRSPRVYSGERLEEAVRKLLADHKYMVKELKRLNAEVEDLHEQRKEQARLANIYGDYGD